MTLKLCVNPPVAGAPLPYIPLNVKLYVAFGVLLLVCTVTAVVVLLEPASVIELDAKLQVELGGNPVQENEMVPVKPFSGVKVSL